MPRIKWRRFASVMTLGCALDAALVMMLSQGMHFSPGAAAVVTLIGSAVFGLTICTAYLVAIAD